MSLDRRTFAVIDPALRLISGHQYEYTKLVLEAADRAGFQVRAWGCRDAAPAIRAEPWFTPHFSSPAVYRSNLDGVLSAPRAAAKFIHREAVWYRELRRLLAGASLEAGDIVFVHTIHNPSLWQWRLAQDWFEGKRVHLFLFLRVAAETVPPGLRAFFEFCCAGMVGRRSYVHLLTDTEDLRTEFERLSGAPLEVVGLPLDPELFTAPCPDKADRNSIVFLGNARSEKGFHLLPEIAQLLLARPGGAGHRFRIQCTPPQGGLDAACRAALERLRQLRDQYGNIELIEAEMSAAEYQQALRDAAILVFPYEQARYAAATSHIVGQALAMGRHCVVTAGTWLAKSVAATGLGIACERTPKAFADALDRCAIEIASGGGARSGAVAAWRRFHCAEAIVDAIVRRAQPRVRSAD